MAHANQAPRGALRSFEAFFLGSSAQRKLLPKLQPEVPTSVNWATDTKHLARSQTTWEKKIYLQDSSPILENGLDRLEIRCGRLGFCCFSSSSASTVGVASEDFSLLLYGLWEENSKRVTTSLGTCFISSTLSPPKQAVRDASLWHGALSHNQGVVAPHSMMLHRRLSLSPWPSC